MWTANIESIEKDVLNIKVGVQYTNGTDVVLKYYNVSDEDSIKSLVSDQIDQFNAVDDLLKKKADLIGAVDLTPTEPVVVPPTQEQTDKNDFVNDYTKLKRYKRAIEEGFITSSDADYLALEKKVKANFKIEYLDNII